MAVEKGYDPHFGARPLRRVIEDNIEDPLSEQILLGKFAYGTKIKAEVEKDNLVFTGKPSAKSERPAEGKREKELQKKA